MGMLPLPRYICPAVYDIRIQLEPRAPSALPPNTSNAINVGISEGAGVPSTTIPDLHNRGLRHKSSRPTRSVSILLMFRPAVLGCSKRDVRASCSRISQGTTFVIGLLIGPKPAKKLTASTRNAADKCLRNRVDFEKALPSKGFARLVYCSRYVVCELFGVFRVEELIESSNIDTARRVLGKLCKSSLVKSAMMN